MNVFSFKVVLVVTFFTVLCSPYLANASSSNDLFELSLSELFEVEITTASNREEQVINAPATVIVVSSADIANRGYESLDEIFVDLPGMEQIYSYGDSSFSNYMRGYRYTIGTPFLMMIDGVTINNLYFNQVTQISAFPLSSVERVEIVYGPASVIYGANAFMGVVNVITKQPNSEGGTLVASHRFDASGGLNLDYRYLFKNSDYSGRFSVHYETFNVADRVNNQTNYWLQDQHYSRALWGGFPSSKVMTDKFDSETSRLGIEAMFEVNDIELSAFYLLEENGYGTTYPSDRIPASGHWPIFQYGAVVNYQRQITPSLESRSRFFVQSDGIKGDAFDIEAWNITNTSDSVQSVGGITLAPDEEARMTYFQYWLTKNHAISLSQDFNYQVNKDLHLLSGVKYDYQDLQRSYILSSAQAISPLAQLTELPRPASGAYDDDDNREIWRDLGLYFQSEYTLSPSHRLSGGFRFDYNNVYGGETTFRGAYIYNRDKWNFKLMYGEAYHEPTPRNLYGAWSGSGADPDLTPERSNTLEASIRYQGQNYSHLLTLYRIKNTDSIVTTLMGAENIGARDVFGFDYHYLKSLNNTTFGDWQFNLYATHYFQSDEDVIDTTHQVSVGHEAIGDLASSKLWMILNWQVNNDLSINIKSRFIDTRKTVSSNPINKIPGYGVSDLNVRYQLPTYQHIELSFRVTNLFDKQYFHPGVRDADASDPLVNSELFNNIGFDEDNPKAWRGSLGWYNSRLPQAERRFVLGINVSF